MSQRLKERLSTAPTWVFTTFAGLAGFITYFSMYAFRKPFTAASFDSVTGWHYELEFKIALVISQLIGYATAKFIGIRVVSGMKSANRAQTILGLIGSAWIALILFALVPAPLKVVAMFLNGLGLGMIWGLVFGYMEGRRTSEILGAMLCASFIVSSGAVKSVGALLMQQLHVPVLWMPATTGLLFMPALFLGVWGLASLPPPSAADEAARVRRAPMTTQEMRSFLAEYGLGIALLVVTYVFATILRDFRDNFAPELWKAVGFRNPAAIFTASELPVAAVSLIAMGVIFKIQDNVKAFAAIHGVLLLGFVLLGGATLAFDAGWLPPVAWMIASGAGMYVVYTPFNAMLFDRLVAVSGRVATAGFLMYVGDSAGYFGSVALLLLRNFGLTQVDWLTVFRYIIYISTVIGLVLTSASLLYFKARTASRMSVKIPAMGNS